MKYFLKKYGIELLIILLSLILGLVEAFLIRDINIQVVTVAIGLLLALTTLAIRREISDQISEQFEFFRLVRKINDEYWRTQAMEELESVRYKLQQWADGNRHISLDESIPYQINLLRRTKRSIDAIHVGLSAKPLSLWSKHHGLFSRLVEAHKVLGGNFRKRRIFIFDDKLLNAQRKIEDSTVLDMCKLQVRQTSEGGLGVDLRILWRSAIDSTRSHVPPDLLIADDAEAVVITGGGEDYDEVKAMEVKAVVNQTQVRMYARLFERHWEMAEPAIRYLE
ncbi:MAG TPA: hypothetical protein VGX48_00515 [Pyrinomonadaceae bacterium]|jgi:hypothetical protein|nr:hypothetical protein [Pyrinomonadaceae bacterium]